MFGSSKKKKEKEKAAVLQAAQAARERAEARRKQRQHQQQQQPPPPDPARPRNDSDSEDEWGGSPRASPSAPGSPVRVDAAAAAPAGSRALEVLRRVEASARELEGGPLAEMANPGPAQAKGPPRLVAGLQALLESERQVRDWQAKLAALAAVWEGAAAAAAASLGEDGKFAGLEHALSTGIKELVDSCLGEPCMVYSAASPPATFAKLKQQLRTMDAAEAISNLGVIVSRRGEILRSAMFRALASIHNDFRACCKELGRVSAAQGLGFLEELDLAAGGGSPAAALQQQRGGYSSLDRALDQRERERERSAMLSRERGQVQKVERQLEMAETAMLEALRKEEEATTAAEIMRNEMQVKTREADARMKEALRRADAERAERATAEKRLAVAEQQVDRLGTMVNALNEELNGAKQRTREAEERAAAAADTSVAASLKKLQSSTRAKLKDIKADLGASFQAPAKAKAPVEEGGGGGGGRREGPEAPAPSLGNISSLYLSSIDGADSDGEAGGGGANPFGADDADDAEDAAAANPFAGASGSDGDEPNPFESGSDGGANPFASDSDGGEGGGDTNPFGSDSEGSALDESNPFA